MRIQFFQILRRNFFDEAFSATQYSLAVPESFRVWS